jgi:hypothetical protein
LLLNLLESLKIEYQNTTGFQSISNFKNSLNSLVYLYNIKKNIQVLNTLNFNLNDLKFLLTTDEEPPIKDNLFDLILKIFIKLNIKDTINLNNYILNTIFKPKAIYSFENDFAYVYLKALHKFSNLCIIKVIKMLKDFFIYKDLIQHDYLDNCNLHRNNVYIIKLLLAKMIKGDHNNNNNYAALINLLLIVKDPIYLYNILNTNLKIYIEKVLQIFQFIKNPDYDIQSYSSIYDSIFQDKKINKEAKASLKLLKFKNFYSRDKLNELSNLISSLDHNNTYYNLNIIEESKEDEDFDEDALILNIFNNKEPLLNFIN